MGWQRGKLDIVVKLDDLAKRDSVRLFAKRDTKVSRFDRAKDKTIIRTIHAGTMILGSFSMPPHDKCEHAVLHVEEVFGGNDRLPMDYYWVVPPDFDWEVYVPVETV